MMSVGAEPSEATVAAARPEPSETVAAGAAARSAAVGAPEAPAAGPSAGSEASVGAEGENTVVDLARIGWLATVIACLIAVLILVVQGYFGYAGVTLAVAISAAINLT